MKSFSLQTILVALSTKRAVVQAYSWQHQSLEEPFQSSFRNLQHKPCVTLYYRNGRSGCGTVDRTPQSGPLFYYDGKQTLPKDQSFVAVIEEYNLSSKYVSKILAANTDGNLKGIMVLNSTYENVDLEYTSTGPMYPLGYGTPSADVSYGNIQFPWNGLGDRLNQYDLYGIPMVYVPNSDTSYYIRNAAKNEEKAVEMYTEFNYYMGPDGVHSKECLAWRDAADDSWDPKCLPLGGTSVWGFAGSPPPKSSSSSSSNSNANNNGRDLSSSAYSSQKPAVIFATSMDSTSMFHDLVPGADEGASNILALIMAAYLIGQSVSDATLDALPKRIVFGFFEGEAYGYLGSRLFLNDVLNFNCMSKYTVNSVANDVNSEPACLYPLRPSLKFKDIGDIAGIVTVDQVGIPSGSGNLYVHNDGSGGIGTFLANVMKYSGTQYYSAVDSAAGQNNGGDYPYPPTPFTALQSLTNGAYGGAVLTGYDYAFTKHPPYQSHFNYWDMDLKSIASAATILARTALAAAYDDGSYDYSTASKYAKNVIGELSYKNEVLVELADCLFVNGNCDMLNNYAAMEAKNEKDRTGMDISSGLSLGKPPNYYVGVYKIDYGQPFVRVGNKWLGAYNGENYGKSNTDAFGMQPKMLQQALRNLMHDFLGRGNLHSDNGSSSKSPRSCRKRSDCSSVSYCPTSGDTATCSASKECVCTRAHYHIALDEAIVPAANNSTGFFEISQSDKGVSPMWTEPFWSNDVGVKMYRVSSSKPGFFALGFGGIVAASCIFAVVLVKVALKKDKFY